MGALYRFDLNPFISKYGLTQYIETGTGEANGLLHAFSYPFIDYYSVDIDEELIVDAWKKVHERTDIAPIKVHLAASRSIDALREWIPNLDSSPCLFFLDAHFPGADFHKISYEESIREYKQDAFPLGEELRIIVDTRDTSKDVFIIDDLMLYEDGAYDGGVEWKFQWLQKELDLETDSSFLYDILRDTHDLVKDTRDQGYLVATPKEKE